MRRSEEDDERVFFEEDGIRFDRKEYSECLTSLDRFPFVVGHPSRIELPEDDFEITADALSGINPFPGRLANVSERSFSPKEIAHPLHRHPSVTANINGVSFGRRGSERRNRLLRGRYTCQGQVTPGRWAERDEGSVEPGNERRRKDEDVSG
ncbi:hypothetical protein KM043_002676 [Ampulex compressa]|nr:hypothetical protein KM043_002676 [Ampulex compressa]